MSHEQNLFAFAEKFPAHSQERDGLIAAATEIVRLRTALVEIRDHAAEWGAAACSAHAFLAAGSAAPRNDS